jgi:hypothetical protein
MSQVIRQLKADPRVHMFIWFIFKDSKQSLWQSGLFNASGAAKSAYRTFSNLAPTVAGDTFAIKAGRAPSVTVAVPRLAAVTTPGTSLGVNYQVYSGSKLITVDQASPVLSTTASVTFTVNFLPTAGTTYRVEMDVNDPSGNHALWTYDLVTPGGKTTAATKKPKKK